MLPDTLVPALEVPLATPCGGVTATVWLMLQPSDAAVAVMPACVAELPAPSAVIVLAIALATACLSFPSDDVYQQGQ